MKALGMLLVGGGFFTILTALAYLGEVDPTVPLANVLYAGLTNLVYAFLALALLLFFYEIGGYCARLARGK